MRSVEELHPGDANARVNVQRIPEVAALNDALTFNGVTGEHVGELDSHINAPVTFGKVALASHEGLFTGPLLRWLYFLSGVLGAAMVVTGAIYWVVKRKPKTAGPMWVSAIGSSNT